jgi:2-polyprenyl-6-hydroxyphenyl methylase/3-demethylubiquinone-9 3-methyltransferase
LELGWSGLAGTARATFYRLRFEKALELVAAYLSPGARVIDIAAAQGNFSLALAERGYEVTWNDLREELAGYVALKHDSGNIRYVAGNAFELNERGFDGALIAEIIEHVAHPDAFLAKVAELVRPGGYIFLTTPNGAYIRNTLPRFSDCPDPRIFEGIQFKPDSNGHIFLLYRDELCSFAERSGLDVERLEFFANPLTSGHMKLASLHRLVPHGAIMTMEAATQRLPMALSERLASQMIACFRKR